MNPVAIILGAVAAAESVIICFLLYMMLRILEAVNNYITPVDPIEMEDTIDD